MRLFWKLFWFCLGKGFSESISLVFYFLRICITLVTCKHLRIFSWRPHSFPNFWKKLLYFPLLSHCSQPLETLNTTAILSWDGLRDLVQFLQFKELGKHPWRSNYSATLLKVLLLLNSFSRFFNCTNGAIK